MKINTVRATAFKGRTFQYNLDPLTQVVGKNFAGKTSIIDAIRLACLGYIPEIGKTNAATWLLSSGPEMRVSIETDDNTLERTFILRNGGVTTTVSDPDLNGKFDIPLLNAAAYFAMTDSERVRYVFERADLPADFTAAGIISQLERLNFGEDHSETVELVKAEVIGKCRAPIEEDVNAALGALTATPKGVLAADYTFWNRRAKETIGTTRILTELKNREGECSAAVMEEIEKRLAGQRTELAAANQRVGKIVQQQHEADRVARRRLEIIEALAKPAYDATAQVEKLNAELKTLRKKGKAKVDPEEIAALRNQFRENDAEMGRLDAITSAAHEAITKALKDMDDLQHVATCPFCKSSGKGWKANIWAEYLATKETAMADKQRAEQKQEAINAADLFDRINALEQKQQEAIQIDREISRIEIQVARLDSERRHDEQMRNRLGDELRGLEQLPNPDAINLAYATQQKEDLEATIQKLETDLLTARRLQQDIQRAAQAELEHQKAEAYTLVLKAVGAKLKEIQAQIVDTVFSGLLAIANSLCGKILKSPLVFKDGEVGRWEDGRFITHKTFSGTECALCYISIAAALSSQAPFRLLILDEMGRLDQDNQVRVLEAIWGAQKAGNIDQAIVVNTEEIRADGWSVITL